MSEDTPRPQRTEIVAAQDARPSADWDRVFAPSPAPAPESAAAPARALPRALQYLKLAFPLIIVLAYVAAKAIKGGDSSGRTAVLAPVESISGVKPAEPDSLRLDRAARAFVSQLEAWAAAGDWGRVADAAANAQPELRGHPVVASLGAVARTRRGERGLELERQLRALEASLRALESSYPELLRELRLARVLQILSRSSDPDVLLMNTDLLHNLLRGDPATPHDVEVRLKVSLAFEQAGDRLAEGARRMLRDDAALLRQARIQYQSALRWATKEAGWRALDPISPAAKVEIARIEQKLRAANRGIHGPSLPFTANDSETWTGRKGALVHDE